LLTGWHDLNKDATSGVDQVTAEAYAVKLHAHIEALVQRLKTKRYRAKLVRRFSSRIEKSPVGGPQAHAGPHLSATS
jgi:hypothetical protein